MKTYFIIFSIFFSSCIRIFNKKQLMPLNDIGDTRRILKKNGFYYSEFITLKSNYNKEVNQRIKDSSSTFSKVGIKTKKIYDDGSIFDLGQWFGILDELQRNKGNLEDINTLESALNHFQNKVNYINRIKKSNYNLINSNSKIWDQGIFRINNDGIKIQTFYNWIGNYYLFEESGILINDTTFVIKNSFDYRTKEAKEANDTFKFKQMENLNEMENFILKNKKKFNQ